MNFKGVIIEESLIDSSVLDSVKILETKIEKVTVKHQTPWVSKWTLHTVEIFEANADKIAKKISRKLDYSHKSGWYVDFKNDIFHYIIFKDKVFKIKLKDIEGYKEASKYGVSLGIPEYQVDFAPEDKVWER